MPKYYVPPAPPFASLPVGRRRHLLRCYHSQLADAYGALVSALQELHSARSFALRNGMQDHAAQVFEFHVRIGYQAHLTDDYLSELSRAKERGDSESPPSKRTSKGRLQ